ncbi:MAG: NAD(P)/FAD-dependent oxidoreductase [Rhizobiaceae bacterium]|nr:NAD(P)/FAD-dependent oxidoreductase [Rhizobiaceae bacterium]
MVNSLQSDVVVIGAGHNSLTAAAYLAKAGLSVTVLEARERIGGGTVTEELTLPGFRHDTFSTGHPWLLTNPMLADNELGIVNSTLSYIGHDPVVVFSFPDGQSLTMWRDKHRTSKEIARFSKHDAEAWLDLYEFWERISPRHLARVRNAPGQAPECPADEAGAEADYVALVAASAAETVNTRFETDYVRAMMLWFASAATQPLGRRGTGLLPVSVPIDWSKHGWINARGGSSSLPEALAGVVRNRGGQVLTSAPVKEIIVDGGRATGVRTSDGRHFTARKAVLSSMHFTRLEGTLPRGQLPAEFVEKSRNWRSGASLFVVQIALAKPHKIRTVQGSVAAVLTGRASVDGLLNQFESIGRNELAMSDPYIFGACSTWIDPSRAPTGAATLKLVTLAPYDLNGDRGNWEGAKADYAQWLLDQYADLTEGFDRADELGRFVQSPVDIEATNSSYQRGNPQGGDMLPDQAGLNRPVKGWANYRMPVPGLYQTGFTTHPGGPVSGWPGRHAARAVLEDLQIDADKAFNAGRQPDSFSCEIVELARL